MIRLLAPSVAVVCALAIASPALAQTCLSTGFAGTTSTTQGCAALMDLSVTNPILIQSIDCNFTAALGVPVTLDVYITPGTWVGNETNIGVWTLVGSGATTSAGAGQPTTFTFASPILLQPGSYGLSLDSGGATSHRYGSSGTSVFNDSSLTITLGAIQPTPFTSSLLNPRYWNGTICYQLGNGLFANFTASPTMGASPLLVNFVDTSFSSDPNGIQTRAWDVDNDGTDDYFTHSCSHTYTASGKYTVKLTVTDQSNPTSVETKTDYITVDPITPDFTATPTIGAAPLPVRFTDTSVGNVITSWAWDFDNDGTDDAFTQNPLWLYVAQGQYSVKLTVGNGSFTESITKTNYVVAGGQPADPGAADVLQYQFNEPRGALVANSAVGSPAPAFGTVKAGSTSSLPNPNWQGDPGRSARQGNEPGFGCLVADSATPYESRVDSGWPFVFSGSHSIAFWIRPVTPDTSSAAYAFGSGSGSARAYNTGSYLSLRSWGTLTSFVDSATDPDSLAGWHHWCMVVDDTAGTAQWFVDGLPDGAVVAFTPNTFTINLGNFIVGAYGTTTSLFTRYFDMDDFRFYGRALTAAEILGCMVKEQAAATTFGDGCAGPGGVPTIAGNGQPTLGNLGFVVNIDQTEAGRVAAILLGTLAVDGGARPLDVSFLFGPGCLAETLPDLGAFVVGVGPNNPFPLPIPNIPALAGGHVYAQGLVFGTSGAVTPALDINLQN